MTSSVPPSPVPDRPADASGSSSAAAVGQQKPPARRRGMKGNWRSLVLSMLVVGAVVFVLYAIVPRPDARQQAAVDVTPVAQQVARDDHLTVQVPQLPEPWRASVARYQRTPQGPKAFYVGYHRTDREDVFVAVQQISAKPAQPGADAWLKEAVHGGARNGTVDIDGRRWETYSTNGNPVRRGIVTQIDGLTTVLSGLADQDTLVEVARSLRSARG